VHLIAVSTNWKVQKSLFSAVCFKMDGPVSVINEYDM